MMFEITVDKQLDVKKDFEIISKEIGNLYPSLNCYNSEIVLNDDKKVDLDDDYIWFDIVNTPDHQTWISAIDFYFFPDNISSSDFPQIKLAELISKALQCNCLCSDIREIVSNLNECDPLLDACLC